MKRLILVTTVLWACMVYAQPTEDTSTPPSVLTKAWKDFTHSFNHAFNHLDVSLTTGATGIGFDASMPLNEWVDVRAGYAIMPRFNYRMHFGVEVGDDPTTSQQKFNRLSGLLEGFTGNQVDNVVDVDGKPTYWNWKLLVDVKPFKNKHWHLTAGLYYGSHEVARAVNAIEDMPSMMAGSIYKNLYSRAMNNDLSFTFGTEVNEDGEEVPRVVNMGEMLKDKLQEYGRMSINMGDWAHDVYYEEDEYGVAPESGVIIDGEYYASGEQYIVHHKGDLMHAKGDPYRMTPDENSMVKAWAYANRFKPYLGFGYGGKLLKKDPRWQISFDCGAMFWGGTPKIVTHEGIDLCSDVEDISGDVGRRVRFFKKFKAFPILELRVTYRLW